MTTKFLNISTDGTLAGNSDSTVVSEKAIKTYVDNNIPDVSTFATKTAAAGSLTGSDATLTLKSVSNATLSTVTVNNVAAATKATKDGDGNTISSTYLKLAGGKMTGVLKFASGSITQNTSPVYYLSMDAFASDGAVHWTSVDNTKAGKDASGNTITSTYATKTELSAKQDTISDLETIRSGAAAGATALQPETAAQTYLPLSGGTMTGNINWTGADNKVVGLQLNNSNANLDFGWTWSTGAGAGFALRSTSYATVAERGAFIFFARNGTSTSNTKQLIGKTDGTLTWAGSAVQTASNKAVANGIASLDANTKIPVAQLPTMTGATSSAAGTSGLVPVPVAGANELFLRGDGTWAEPQGGGGGTGPSRNIGEIVPSTIPLTDAGLHLLDGSVISSGSYTAFVSYIAGLVSSHSELFVTESEWQQSITDYGVCGKFVYNSTNNTVRLPKITGIVEGTTDLTALGDLIEAGIPNHFHAWGYNNQDNAGNFSAANNPGITIDQPVCDGQTFGTRSWNGSGGGGGFTASDTYQNANMTTTVGVPSEGVNGTGTSGDAHGIMGNSETVQPQTIKILFYIVISNATKTEIEVDIDEIATDLAAKVDRAELDEVQCIVETYNNGSSWYRVWSDGWCEQGGRTVASSGTGFETVILLKPYANINYSLSVTNLSGASKGDYRGGSIVSGSTITVGYDNGQSSWETKGYI